METVEEGYPWNKLCIVMKYYDVEGVDSKIRKIGQYMLMLSERREWAGLTSRKMEYRIGEAVAESLTVLGAESCVEKEVVEIGSGGGVLGVVISIVCPQWAVTMTERSGRKSAFLAEVVGKIGIDNAEVFHGDARLLAGTRKFDLCLSRASGRLVEVAPIAMDLLKKGGRYIALKQKDVKWEVEEARAAIENNGGMLEAVGGAKEEREETGGDLSLVVIVKS
jgi:16S rRNA (guanine527-N7)-methyltransferase